MGLVMKIFITLCILVALFLYQNNVTKQKNKEEILLKNKVFQELNDEIKVGMNILEIEEILKNKKISYYYDKNKNIDILGKGLTLEINSQDNFHKFEAHSID
jgi:hypothetical protein